MINPTKHKQLFTEGCISYVRNLMPLMVRSLKDVKQIFPSSRPFALVAFRKPTIFEPRYESEVDYLEWRNNYYDLTRSGWDAKDRMQTIPSSFLKTYSGNLTTTFQLRRDVAHKNVMPVELSLYSVDYTYTIKGFGSLSIRGGNLSSFTFKTNEVTNLFPKDIFGQGTGQLIVRVRKVMDQIANRYRVV